MDVQYVYDIEGKQTGVIVPIELWNKISPPMEGVKKGKIKWDPSKYKGMYKSLEVDVNEESRSLRDEWTRI